METTPPYRVDGNLYSFARPITRSEILKVAEDIVTADFYSRKSIKSEEDAKQFFHAKLAHKESETFARLFLCSRHKVIAYEELFHGTIDSCSIHPREVVKRCLHYNAAALMCCHQHPSGRNEPSAADRAITMRLKEALELIDVRLIDHIVVAPGATPTSLAGRGWV